MSNQSVTTSALVAAALRDPAVHRQLETDFIRHVEQLLEDDRLRVDTTSGRRPVSTMLKTVQRTDRSVDLKRIMSEMRKPDRDLQHQMPVGESMEITSAAAQAVCAARGGGAGAGHLRFANPRIAGR